MAQITRAGAIETDAVVDTFSVRQHDDEDFSVTQRTESIQSLEEVAAEPMPTVRPPRSMQTLLATAALPPGLLPSDENGDSGQALASIAALAGKGDARLEVGWAPREITWAPTNLCHLPLYFEQVNLERHGYTLSRLWQPVLSGAHFFAAIPTLPYKMTVDSPAECIYTLGYYRPGSLAPRRWQGLPWEHRAAAVEAATAVGLVLLLP